MNTLRLYYSLAKPGIIYGNALTAAGGFFLASHDLARFALMLAGLSCIIASGCIMNNYIDRDIDAHMARTKNRALVRGQVPAGHALALAGVLGALGTGLLLFGTTLLAVLFALLGLFAYVVLYSLLAKRTGVWGTHVGALSGALPPLIGYTAGSGQFTLAALLLFAALFVWQMPHFYAIAARRKSEYAAAGIPALPLVYGPRTAAGHSLGYIALFVLAAVVLGALTSMGVLYLGAMLALCLGWFALGLRWLQRPSSARAATHVFAASLVVLSLWSVLLIVESFVRL